MLTLSNRSADRSRWRASEHNGARGPPRRILDGEFQVLNGAIRQSLIETLGLRALVCSEALTARTEQAGADLHSRGADEGAGGALPQGHGQGRMGRWPGHGGRSIGLGQAQQPAPRGIAGRQPAGRHGDRGAVALPPLHLRRHPAQDLPAAVQPLWRRPALRHPRGRRHPRGARHARAHPHRSVGHACSWPSPRSTTAAS